MIQIKRAYDPAGPEDGRRFLVDRFWPRGIKKEALNLVAWQKEAAPSSDLCRWFGHDPEKWDEFRKRYISELKANQPAWEPLLEAARHGPITLVYGARDTEHNQAVALKEFLDRQG
ncbi:MAG TPA: DUF488 domain-containing protein [Anaerolineales bacterium]